MYDYSLYQRYKTNQVMVSTNKCSAPRAADTARYARASKNATKTCKGGRTKRPIIWCEQRIENAKSCLFSRAKSLVLCCVLAGGVTF